MTTHIEIIIPLVILLFLQTYVSFGQKISCDETQFKCVSASDDRQCIPKDFVNDGEEDCSDGSDEHGEYTNFGKLFSQIDTIIATSFCIFL